jgi:hypothetical protein
MLLTMLAACKKDGEDDEGTLPPPAENSPGGGGAGSGSGGSGGVEVLPHPKPKNIRGLSVYTAFLRKNLRQHPMKRTVS